MYGDKKFQVSVEGSDGSRVVSLSGELDIATVQEFTPILPTLADGVIVIDLSDVGFIDMAALDMLVQMKADNPAIRFITNPRLDHIAELAGVEDQFDGAGTPDVLTD